MFTFHFKLRNFVSECRAQPTNYEHFQINGDTILHVSMPYSFRILVSWECSLKTIPCIKNVQNVQMFRQEAPLSSKKIVVRAFGSESHACLASEFLRLTSFCMFFSSTSAYWKEYVEHYYAAEGGIDKMRLLDRRSLFYTKYCFFLVRPVVMCGNRRSLIGCLSEQWCIERSESKQTGNTMEAK